MDRPLLRRFLPSIIVFILFNAAFIIFSDRLEKKGFDSTVLLIGNVLLFAITAISFLMGAKALRTQNTHAFFRLVYGSFILKLLFLAIAAFAYIMTEKKDVNKPSLFVCMGLYLIYTFIEVNILVKTVRKKTDV